MDLSSVIAEEEYIFALKRGFELMNQRASRLAALHVGNPDRRVSLSLTLPAYLHLSL